MTNKITEKVTTPKAKAQWAKVVTPDAKFGKYSIDLILEDSPELQVIIDKANNIVDRTIKAEMAQAAAEGKPVKKILKSNKFPIREELDSQGEPTGRYVIKASSPSKTKENSKFPSRDLPAPVIVSQANRVLTANEKSSLRILNGSIVRVGLSLSGYYFSGEAGVSAKLQIVQLIELASSNGSSVDVNDFDFGVEGEETGFSSIEESSSSETSSDNEDF
jgi:hypothetical protein